LDFGLPAKLFHRFTCISPFFWLSLRLENEDNNFAVEVKGMTEPEGRLLEERVLDSGRKVYFYDQSRPIVGDRRQVQLLIHVPLEIKPAHFEGCEDPVGAYQACVSAFGKEMPFCQQKVRNFINNGDAEAVLEKMKEEFLQSGLNYLSKPRFAENYIMKRYSEWARERACAIAHTEAIQRAEE
jgi:hypothetical protein